MPKLKGTRRKKARESEAAAIAGKGIGKVIAKGQRMLKRKKHVQQAAGAGAVPVPNPPSQHAAEHRKPKEAGTAAGHATAPPPASNAHSVEPTAYLHAKISLLENALAQITPKLEQLSSHVPADKERAGIHRGSGTDGSGGSDNGNERSESKNLLSEAMLERLNLLEARLTQFDQMMQDVKNQVYLWRKEDEARWIQVDEARNHTAKLLEQNHTRLLQLGSQWFTLQSTVDRMTALDTELKNLLETRIGEAVVIDTAAGSVEGILSSAGTDYAELIGDGGSIQLLPLRQIIGVH